MCELENMLPQRFESANIIKDWIVQKFIQIANKLLIMREITC